jgi:hypothetical protein
MATQIDAAPAGTLTSRDRVGDPVLVKTIVATIAAVLVLAATLGPAVAQGQYMQVDGWVQWLSADKLQLVLDSGLSISVDLTKVPQSEYQALGLGPRDRISVVGVVSADNRKLIASSVVKVGRGAYQAP